MVLPLLGVLCLPVCGGLSSSVGRSVFSSSSSAPPSRSHLPPSPGLPSGPCSVQPVAAHLRVAFGLSPARRPLPSAATPPFAALIPSPRPVYTAGRLSGRCEPFLLGRCQHARP